MAYEHIRLEQSPAAVATITIARPDRLNALSGRTLDELRSAVEESARSGARCLLLTGEGRGFSSGAISPAGGDPDDVGASLETHFNPLIEAIVALPTGGGRGDGPCAGAAALAPRRNRGGWRLAYLLRVVNIGLIPAPGAGCAAMRPRPGMV